MQVPAGWQGEIQGRFAVGGRSSHCSQMEARYSVAVKEVAVGHPAEGPQPVVEPLSGKVVLESEAQGLWLHQAGLLVSPENIKVITSDEICYEKHRKSYVTVSVLTGAVDTIMVKHDNRPTIIISRNKAKSILF